MCCMTPWERRKLGKHRRLSSFCGESATPDHTQEALKRIKRFSLGVVPQHKDPVAGPGYFAAFDGT